MSKKLLLVEQSQAIQKLVELALSKEEVEVMTVPNGLSALEILSKVPPDILMVDSQMDGMGIHVFLAKIKEGLATHPTPVLLLTEPEEWAESDSLRASGVLGCIEKPFDTSRLREKVMNALQGTLNVPAFTDPEETMVVQSHPESQAPDSQAPQSKEKSENMVKIEDLLGWTDDEKSPFSELEEESQEDDLSFSFRETDAPKNEKGGAVVIEEEDVAVDRASPDMPQEPKQDLKQELPNEGLTGPAVISEDVPQETLSPTTESGPQKTSPPMDNSVPMPQVPELSSEQMEAIVSKISRDMIEKVVWEVVPSLAEMAIKKEIERIKSEDPS